MKRLALLSAVAMCASPALAQEVPALGPPGAQQAVLSRGGTQTAAQNQSNGQTMPQGWPGQISPVSPDRPLSSRERRNVGMATHWRLRACTPEQRADGVLEFTHGACEITVVCAPLRVCAIALEPGEAVTDLPDLGDPRWQVQRRVVGTGAQRTIHAIVKPSDAGLDTNLTIPTNRRILSIRLVSRRNEYMPFVSIRGSGSPSSSMQREWGREVALGTQRVAQAASPCDQQPTVPPSGFRIGHSSSWASAPAWQPVQAYVVATPTGQVTCIDFPADLGASDLPALVAYDRSGTERVVTARWAGRRYAVDGVFPRMAVVGANFETIRIERRGR